MNYFRTKVEDAAFVVALLHRRGGWTWIMTIMLCIFAAFCAFVAIVIYTLG